MSKKSVCLEIALNTSVHVTARKARELLRSKQAYVVSHAPYRIRLTERVTRWSQRSENFIMSGAAFEKRPPTI